MSFRYCYLASQCYRACLPSLAQSSCRAVNFCTHCPPGPSSLSWATHGLQCSQCIVYTLQPPTLLSSHTSLARSSLHSPLCNFCAFGVGMPRSLSWTRLISLRYSFIHPFSGLNLLACIILAPHTLIDPYCSSQIVRLWFVVLLVSCVIVSQLHFTGAAARFSWRSIPYQKLRTLA